MDQRQILRRKREIYERAVSMRKNVEQVNVLQAGILLRKRRDKQCDENSPSYRKIGRSSSKHEGKPGRKLKAEDEPEVASDGSSNYRQGVYLQDYDLIGCSRGDSHTEIWEGSGRERLDHATPRVRTSNYRTRKRRLRVVNHEMLYLKNSQPVKFENSTMTAEDKGFVGSLINSIGKQLFTSVPASPVSNHEECVQDHAHRATNTASPCCSEDVSSEVRHEVVIDSKESFTKQMDCGLLNDFQVSPKLKETPKLTGGTTGETIDVDGSPGPGPTPRLLTPQGLFSPSPNREFFQVQPRAGIMSHSVLPSRIDMIALAPELARHPLELRPRELGLHNDPKVMAFQYAASNGPERTGADELSENTMYGAGIRSQNPSFAGPYEFCEQGERNCDKPNQSSYEAPKHELKSVNVLSSVKGGSNNIINPDISMGASSADHNYNKSSRGTTHFIGQSLWEQASAIHDPSTIPMSETHHYTHASGDGRVAPEAPQHTRTEPLLSGRGPGAAFEKAHSGPGLTMAEGRYAESRQQFLRNDKFPHFHTNDVRPSQSLVLDHHIPAPRLGMTSAVDEIPPASYESRLVRKEYDSSPGVQKHRSLGPKSQMQRLVTPAEASAAASALGLTSNTPNLSSLNGHSASPYPNSDYHHSSRSILVPPRSDQGNRAKLYNNPKAVVRMDT